MGWELTGKRGVGVIRLGGGGKDVYMIPRLEANGATSKERDEEGAMV